MHYYPTIWDEKGDGLGSFLTKKQSEDIEVTPKSYLT